MTSKDQAATSPGTFDVNDPVFQQIVAQAVAARLAAVEHQMVEAGAGGTQA